MLYRCITNIERKIDKKKRQTASFSYISKKKSVFMCQTSGGRNGDKDGRHNSCKSSHNGPKLGIIPDIV